MPDIVTFVIQISEFFQITVQTGYKLYKCRMNTYCHEESVRLPLKFDFIGGLEFLSQLPSIDQPIEPPLIWMAGNLVLRLRCGAGKFLAFLGFFVNTG
jgi:hypothetical protein